MLFFIIVFFRPFPRYTGVRWQWGAVFVQPEGHSTSWGLHVCRLFYVTQWLCSLVSTPLRVCPLVWKVAQTFCSCSRWADRRTAGCWCIRSTCCRRALKNIECFSSLQWFCQGQFCFFIVTIPFVKDGQSLFKSVERFPLNPDCLLALSWTGSHWYSCWH